MYAYASSFFLPNSVSEALRLSVVILPLEAIQQVLDAVFGDRVEHVSEAGDVLRLTSFNRDFTAFFLKDLLKVHRSSFCA